MIIGVLKEPFPETRISILPEHVAILKKWNVQVIVEDGAGITAFANNDKYIDAGETQTRSYLAFMAETPAGFTGAGHVNFENNKLLITDTTTGKQITIQTTLKADGI